MDEQLQARIAQAMNEAQDASMVQALGAAASWATHLGPIAERYADSRSARVDAERFDRVMAQLEEEAIRILALVHRARQRQRAGDAW